MMKLNETLTFDIFLSYKSEDSQWVKKLKNSLQNRGVRVWVDKDEIRPGDLFVEALENGLETSKSVGLIVTPQSLESKWVKEEYYRAVALSRDKNLQLIPIILKDAELPGFLSNRQYVDFREESQYDLNVNRLVWPGITGKKIVLFVINSRGGIPWQNLTTVFEELDCEIRFSDYVETAPLEIEKFLNPSYRVVGIADMFEAWPWNDGRAYRKPKSYTEVIFGIREATRNTENEVVFVLYQNENALKDHAPLFMEEEVIKRLSHYFMIPMSFNDKIGYGEAINCKSPEYVSLKKSVFEVWIRVQRELLRGELKTKSFHHK